MITLLFIILAAFFNAVMDAVENENFYESIFRNKNERFWYKRVSWKYAKKIAGYKLDAWHLAKSMMVVCVVLGMALYRPIVGGEWFIDVVIYGIVWNAAFIIFYHKIFKVK